MGIIKKEEIRGYRFENEIVCPDCATDAELKDLNEDEIITDNEIENGDEMYFCDRCKKEL